MIPTLGRIIRKLSKLRGQIICKATRHLRGLPVVLEGKRYFQCPRCERLRPHKVRLEGKPALKVAAG